MELLGIGPLELIFVLVIALIIIGPKDMGKTARSIGRFLNRLYKSEGWRSFLQASRNLRSLPGRLAREAELEELRQVKKAVTDAGQEVARDLRAIEADLKVEGQQVARDLRAVEADPWARSLPEPPSTEAAPVPPKVDAARD